jgi:hypothetical protein
MAFEDIMLALRSLGFYDFLLPWLFTFAVVYGLLSVTKIFGDKTPRIATALALVIAFFVTGYSGQMLSNFFTNLFGGATMIIAGILVVLLFATMVGFKSENMKDMKRMGVLVILLIIGIVLWLLSTGVAKGFGFLPLMSPDVIALILVMVVIVIAIWAIVREPGTSTSGGAGAGTKAGG